MAYNTGIARGQNNSISPDPLVPQPVVAQIIQELPHASVLFNRARRVTMSALTTRMPVLSVLPTAYFIGTSSDNALKQTSAQDWDNVTLTAEELAVIIPVPQAYFDDALVPIWDEVRPRLVSAIGKAVDAAALFGVNRPSTWSTDIYTACTSAGNHVTDSTDPGVGVATLGQVLAEQGFAGNGFATAPGYSWNLAAYRTSQGLPIYQPGGTFGPLGEPIGGSLYGYEMQEVFNGSWDSTKASLIFGNWQNAIVGLRQDITFDIFDTGVISDGSGVVVTNLMQQDTIAIRCVARVAFATSNPVTEVHATASTRFPFAYMGPVTGLS